MDKLQHRRIYQTVSEKSEAKRKTVQVAADLENIVIRCRCPQCAIGTTNWDGNSRKNIGMMKGMGKVWVYMGL